MSGGITVCIKLQGGKMWVEWKINIFFYDFLFCPEDGAIDGDILGPV